ncbi:MAG TPA: ABC transporter permease [Bryobacteraceae bacterium]|nr:ABC transporter permease [Bryobacteraceae bacterium]
MESRRRDPLRLAFVAPASMLMLVTLVVPSLIIVVYSLLTRGAFGGAERPFTFENFTLLADPLYLAIFWRSLWIAAVSTALCLALAFPLAMFIAKSGARKNLYLSLVILPFWTSFLIRLYAWMFLLRDTGLINTILQSLHIIHDPLPMLYNDGAVILGLVYGYLPFAVLPLYATLERLDKSLFEAAADLGATPGSALLRVTIPLSAPGIRAAAILVFVPCLGTYLTSDLLGGSKTILLGNLVQNQFTTARDWPFGAAISILLLAIAMVLLLAARRSGEELL